MDTIITFLLFFIIFTVIVVAHEGGHFLVAKKCGIKVYEFMVGIGPALVSFNKGGTKYSLRLFPLGGACVYDDLAELGNDDEDRVYDDCHFRNAKVWDRIATVFAGPLFNFLLAFILGIFVISAVGVDRPVISDVMDGFPAKEAGIMGGDEILSLNNHRIFFYRELSMFTLFYKGGDNVSVEYLRDGKKYTTVIVPKYFEEEERYLFGFQGYVGRVKVNPIATLGYSIWEVKYWVESTIKSLGMLFNGGASVKDLSGPVGVAQVVGDTYTESKSDGVFYIWLNMLNIAILLSSNLGVMNLLPIPAFDGGKLCLLFFEAITKVKPSQKVEAAVNIVGFLCIISLMILVMFNDVSRLFG